MTELVYELEDLGNYAILTNSLASIKEDFKEERVEEVWKTWIPLMVCSSRKFQELMT